MTALGIVLLALAVVLLLAEAHLSTGGLVAAAAGAAVIAGMTLLLLAAGAGAVLVAPVALAGVLAATSVLLLGRRRILRQVRTRPSTGAEALVGRVAVVRSSGGRQARVSLGGSLWRAEPNPIHQEPALHAGDHVVVESVHGLTLSVRRAEEWELNP